MSCFDVIVLSHRVEQQEQNLSKVDNYWMDVLAGVFLYKVTVSSHPQDCGSDVFSSCVICI